MNRNIFTSICLMGFLLLTGCAKTELETQETDSDNQPSAANKSTIKLDRNAKRTVDTSAWELAWSDEFDGETLNLDKWKFETGASGWGNKEWQNYTAGDNVEVSDGKLKITAKLVGEGQKVGDYTSTRLNSKFSFAYGRVEVSAKMPALKGKGIWPAIWTLGDNIQTVGWPDCGELDILEYLSFIPDSTRSAVHTKAFNHRIKTQIESGSQTLETIEEEFHVYGVEWTETQINFFVDEPTNVHLTFNRPENPNDDTWPFTKPQHLLLNLAVGGWGGTEGVDDTIFPSTMEIEYVRVYQPKKE